MCCGWFLTNLLEDFACNILFDFLNFITRRVRIITTLVCVVAIVFTLKQWPEVRDIGSHVMKRLKDTLDQ